MIILYLLIVKLVFFNYNRCEIKIDEKCKNGINKFKHAIEWCEMLKSARKSERWCNEGSKNRANFSKMRKYGDPKVRKREYGSAWDQRVLSAVCQETEKGQPLGIGAYLQSQCLPTDKLSMWDCFKAQA